MTANKNQVASEICSDIKYICKSFKNRSAGSEGEKQTSDYFVKELSSCADEVKSEEFKVNPSAFTGWIALSISCVLLGIVAYFFSSLVALLLFVIALLPFLLQYIFYKRALDPLYSEKTSQNVTALKKCTEEPKKRLYFVAHTDASYENSLKYRFGGIALISIIAADMIGLIYFTALSITRWVLVGGVGASIASGAMLYAGLAGLAFVFVLFATYFMISHKVIVDGANNNLTGCFVASRVLGALKDIQFKNTEIGVILAGSGAVGLRGSKAWCDAHKDEVDKENTAFVSLYTLRELGSLNVTSSEMNGIVRSDKELCKLVLDSAKELGLKCSNHKIPFDASDSATFAENGFKSTCICAINSKLPDYYSTRYDSYDNLNDECIAECYALALEIVKRFSGEEFDLGEAPVADTAVENTAVNDGSQDIGESNEVIEAKEA